MSTTTRCRTRTASRRSDRWGWGGTFLSTLPSHRWMCETDPPDRDNQGGMSRRRRRRSDPPLRGGDSGSDSFCQAAARLGGTL
jgi:hypothetical protein